METTLAKKGLAPLQSELTALLLSKNQAKQLLNALHVVHRLLLFPLRVEKKIVMFVETVMPKWSLLPMRIQPQLVLTKSPKSHLAQP